MEEVGKRVMDEDFANALSNKRVALGESNPSQEWNAEKEDQLMFKILCPTSLAGMMIGKGGSVINEINANCGAKVKLSQNTEFYPGTQERIVILTGDKESLEKAIKEVVTKIGEAPERTKPSGDPLANAPVPANRGPTGTVMLKCLVPKLASGTLIGKGGSVVKAMAESSGCRINLAEENDPFNTRERIVIVNGPTVPEVVLGVQAVMTQLMSVPSVRTYNTLTCQYPNAGPPSMSMPGMPMMSMMPGMPMGMRQAPAAAPPAGMPGIPAGYMAVPQPLYAMQPGKPPAQQQYALVPAPAQGARPEYQMVYTQLQPQQYMGMPPK